MRTVMMLVVGTMALVGCSGAPEGPAGRSETPLIEADGDVPTPSPRAHGPECPSGLHACSLGATGYDCRDLSWYYCAAEDAGCRTPAPCVPEPLDGGPDAIAAWFEGR